MIRSGPIFPNFTPRSAAPQFDSRSIDVRLITLDLSTARTDEEYYLKGNFIWAADATSLDARVDIKFNSQAGDDLPLLRGVSIGGVPFTRVFLTNTAQTGDTITLFTATEPQQTSFLRITNPDVNLVDATGFNNADTDPVVATGLSRAQTFPYGYNGGSWDRLRGAVNNSDNLSVVSRGARLSQSNLYAFNGLTWDRLRSVGNDTDAKGTASLGRLNVVNYPYIFNETNFDRQRGNTETTVLSSAARTADPTISDQTNYNARGVEIFINVSALAATPSITPTVYGVDSISGNNYTLLTGTAITATGLYRLVVYPGITAIANESANDIIPRTWTMDIVHADADSITYSVSAAYIL